MKPNGKQCKANKYVRYDINKCVAISLKVDTTQEPQQNCHAGTVSNTVTAEALSWLYEALPTTLLSEVILNIQVRDRFG